MSCLLKQYLTALTSTAHATRVPQISIAGSFLWLHSHLLCTPCTVLHNSNWSRHIVHTTKPPHVYTHTPSNPNPDPATKLLLFHSTQGKWQRTQPFRRLSATNSVGAEEEGRQLNMFFVPSGKCCMCIHTRPLSLSLSLARYLSHILMYGTLQ